MKKIKSIALKLWQDESGQGTAEYVLILVGIVAVGFIFKKQITEMLTDKLGKIGTEVRNF